MRCPALRDLPTAPPEKGLAMDAIRPLDHLLGQRAGRRAECSDQSINRGLERGSGLYATWINSDDMLCRDALATRASRIGSTQYTGIPFGMFRLHRDQKTHDGWRQTQSLLESAARLVARADTLTEETRQAILVDLRTYEHEYWWRTGRLARVGLPRRVVMRLRQLRAAL